MLLQIKYSVVIKLEIRIEITSNYKESLGIINDYTEGELSFYQYE
jgi:hypothetical protein